MPTHQDDQDSGVLMRVSQLLVAAPMKHGSHRQLRAQDVAACMKTVGGYASPVLAVSVKEVRCREGSQGQERDSGDLRDVQGPVNVIASSDIFRR